MMTAAKRLGLYSELRQFSAISLRLSPVTPKLAVDTIFCNSGFGMSVWGRGGFGGRATNAVELPLPSEEAVVDLFIDPGPNG